MNASISNKKKYWRGPKTELRLRLRFPCWMPHSNCWNIIWVHLWACFITIDLLCPLHLDGLLISLPSNILPNIYSIPTNYYGNGQFFFKKKSMTSSVYKEWAHDLPKQLSVLQEQNISHPKWKKIKIHYYYSLHPTIHDFCSQPTNWDPFYERAKGAEIANIN